MSAQSDAAIAYLNSVNDSLEIVVKYAAEVKAYTEKFKDAAIDTYNGCQDKLNNPPTGGIIGATEYIDCVKALAPMQKIDDCLKGGGAVDVLWGTPSQIANAQKLRVMRVFPDYIRARRITDTPTQVWAESKDVELAKPEKYILRIRLLPRFSA